MRRALIGVLLIGAALPAPAHAGWAGASPGAAFSGAGNMPTGGTPSASVTGQDVAVTWSPVDAGGSPASGYLLRRYDLGGVEQTIGGGCDGVQSSTSCVEQDVPPGSWVYRVRPLRFNWSGGEGPPSNTAAVSPPAVAIDTTAWDLRDASSGSESNQSDATAFADGRLRTTSAVQSAFSASRYLQFNYSPSLDVATTVSGSSFGFRFSASGSGRTSCFYFDVRRTSTGAVLATHGSPTTPVGCVTGTTLQTFTTAIPSVNSGSLANDLSVRVYLRDSGSSTVRIDAGTVGGGTPQPLAFTLYEEALVDSTNGTAATVRWPLSATDATVYTSAANWTTSFNTSRYLRLTFPPYVPTGATVTDASFTHAYRSNTSGTTCWYFGLYSGTSLIGTHGSASSPISCNSSTSAYVTDTVALPELDTVAEANGAAVRIYVRNSSSLRSRHDQATLSLDYE